MEIRKTTIPNCYEITPMILKDIRGCFVKTFHQEVFKQHQLETTFTEEYYSISYQNALRGLHFQLPPHEHTKMVYCVQGQVMDAVVDLRVGSPTYGKFETFDLSAEKANIMYIPPGLAHGFYVLSETAIMLYKVSTVYAAKYDTGIHWDSVGISWQALDPIVSERDKSFKSFSNFQSPFIYKN
ncbi:dTDP-4-dehydrorhamnose 3,5-epimerase [Coleofasciculus sp.]|uniref:dTDP-4-dehydrorhamnose 3,5-epimerase n=1 Tax=Coleofasciculus sp. TaxID=3100458 RepID=UPI0039F886B3